MSFPNDTHVSRHLTWQELACHDAARTPYPAEWRTTRALALANAFEAIRAACTDTPIHVLSGYRTREHNAAVGGVPLSQHCEGRALDLYTPRGFARDEFVERIRATYRSGSPIRGLGIYPWGCHVDVRPADKLIVWRAKRAESVR